MEYASHGNLRKFLRKSRKVRNNMGTGESFVSNLSPNQLLNFALGVAKAMVHISNAGVRIMGPHVLYKDNQTSVNDIFGLKIWKSILYDFKICVRLTMSSYLFKWDIQNNKERSPCLSS